MLRDWLGFIFMMLQVVLNFTVMHRLSKLEDRQ